MAFQLGPWEDVLLHEITPQLERLSESEAPQVSWMSFDERVLVPEFALALWSSGSPQRPISFSILGQGLASDSALPGLTPNGVQQSLIMPSVSQQLAPGSFFTVSAVLASQTFAVSGVDLADSPALAASPFAPQGGAGDLNRAVHGAGVRLAISGEISDRLSFDAAYQSRIDMARVASLRGVHGSLADLDIPSRVNLGLNLQATSRSALRLGVEQVFFSEIGAFPSRSLPARFNALLGDSTSPSFDWDDLLVYTVGWQWRNDSDLALFIDYRTQTQPRPTADVLANALSSEMGQDAVMAGVIKGIGERGQFSLNAAYAPPDIAHGARLLGLGSDSLDQALEFQATFRVSF